MPGKGRLCGGGGKCGHNRMGGNACKGRSCQSATGGKWSVCEGLVPWLFKNGWRARFGGKLRPGKWTKQAA